jgi:hypothetical protein
MFFQECFVGQHLHLLKTIEHIKAFLPTYLIVHHCSESIASSHREGYQYTLLSLLIACFSQACQSRGKTLWCQSIKCPCALAGTGVRGSAGNARVGALERSGPRPRGCLALERGGLCSRGGVEPSSEADPALGGVKASSEADLARGRVYLSSEADLTREASAVLPWQAAGTTRVVVVLCVFLGMRVDLCFAFFVGFKRVSPGHLGDPYGCPRQ